MKNFLNQNFQNNKVLVRVDFNVPLDKDLNVTDDSRIKAALPTINKLISDKAKIILMSHLGRPNGFEKSCSLKNLVPILESVFSTNVSFSESCFGEKVTSAIKKMRGGDILLLENLRFHKEEKLGDFNFAKKLSSLADVYVNDAFGTSHRNHSSVATISQFFPNKKYFGVLLEKEIDVLDKVLKSPKRPFTAIIGGSKVSTKINLLSSLMEKVDNLIIGGGMAYTFIHSMGGNIGNSILEKEKIDLAKKIMEKAKKLNVNLLLPVDSINANSFKNPTLIKISDINSVQNELMGVDIGEKSIDLFSKVIEFSKTVVWNGPMGVFEIPSFEKGTKLIGESICRSTSNGCFSLIGGGDSAAAVKKFNLSDGVSYISTGGGAMLEYLEGKTLPGIQSIRQ